MNSHPPDPLWSAVHEALDARRPPLADESVQALLEEQPERLGEVLALLDVVRPIETAASLRRPRLGRVAAAVAALVLLAFGAWLAFGRDDEQPVRRAPETVDAEASEPLGTVLSWRMEIVTESPSGREVLRRGDGRLEREIVPEPVHSSTTPEGRAEMRLALSTERRLPE